MLAFAYIIGIALFVTILNPVGPLDPVEEIAFLMEKQTIMYITMLFIYVISGLALVVLVQALYERLKVNALVTIVSALEELAMVFGRPGGYLPCR